MRYRTSQLFIFRNFIAHFFALLVFFGTHLKSPSFVRDFFIIFFRIADMLNSLRREFHFFPTTLSFWVFWGSVGTFRFFPAGFQVLELRSFSFTGFVDGRKLHLLVVSRMTYLLRIKSYETWEPGGLGAPPAVIWWPSWNLLIPAYRKLGTAV